MVANINSDSKASINNELDILELFKYSNITQTFFKGETIFEEGSAGNYMYLILEGEVNVEINNRVIAKVGSGQILGEMALLENRPRSASAVAKSECEVVPIDNNSLLYLVRETPAFALFLMKDLCSKIRENHD
jgi:CRP-like cAMP-binding protein